MMTTQRKGIRPYGKKYLGRARLIGGLGCGVPRKIEYEPAKRQGTIYMEPLYCTDMSGAIALFTTIDPEVEVIVTIAGDARDTVYRRELGKWNGYDEREPQQ